MILSGDQLNEDDFHRITGKIYLVILCVFINYLVHLVFESVDKTFQDHPTHLLCKCRS